METFISYNTSGIRELDLIHCHDLKVIAISTGIQQASSKHPCPYCHWIATYTLSKGAQTNPAKPAPLRTFGSNRINHDNYMAKGGNKKKAMEDYNCTEDPLISYNDDVLIMEKYPPPELHMFTGIFNHMYNGMLADPDLCDSAVKWADIVGVSRAFCPSLSFVGNHCRRLLKNDNRLLDTSPPRSVHKDC